MKAIIRQRQDLAFEMIPTDRGEYITLFKWVAADICNDFEYKLPSGKKVDSIDVEFFSLPAEFEDIYPNVKFDDPAELERWVETHQDQINNWQAVVRAYNLFMAAVNLEDSWLSESKDFLDNRCKDFPFTESFDDVRVKIGKWFEEIKQ